MISTRLEKSIMETVCYFDLFDFPLSELEIYKYLLMMESDFLTVIKTIEKLRLQSDLDFDQGRFFLPGRKDILDKRSERYLLSQNKIKKTRRWARLIYQLPFIEDVYICNDLSYLNAHDGSDLDLAIVVKPGRIWTLRFLSAGLMALFRQRPRANNHRNKICLSFFVTSDNLNLEKVAYENDLHFWYWIAQFLPLSNDKQRFYMANAWLKKYLPNYQGVQVHPRWCLSESSFLKKSMEFLLAGFFGNWVEMFLKKVQRGLLPEKLRIKAEENNSDVIINSKILKFHDHDARLSVLTRWQEKCKAIIK